MVSSIRFGSFSSAIYIFGAYLKDSLERHRPPQERPCLARRRICRLAQAQPCEYCGPLAALLKHAHLPGSCLYSIHIPSATTILCISCCSSRDLDRRFSTRQLTVALHIQRANPHLAISRQLPVAVASHPPFEHPHSYSTRTTTTAYQTKQPFPTRPNLTHNVRYTHPQPVPPLLHLPPPGPALQTQSDAHDGLPRIRIHATLRPTAARVAQIQGRRNLSHKVRHACPMARTAQRRLLPSGRTYTAPRSTTDARDEPAYGACTFTASMILGLTMCVDRQSSSLLDRIFEECDHTERLHLYIYPCITLHRAFFGYTWRLDALRR